MKTFQELYDETLQARKERGPCAVAADLEPHVGATRWRNGGEVLTWERPFLERKRRYASRGGALAQPSFWSHQAWSLARSCCCCLLGALARCGCCGPIPADISARMHVNFLYLFYVEQHGLASAEKRLMHAFKVVHTGADSEGEATYRAFANGVVEGVLV